MKQYVLFFTLMLIYSISGNIYASKYGQDSTIISSQKKLDTINPKPKKKIKAMLFDASGSDVTQNIKEVFLNGNQIQMHNLDSIKAKDIKSITTKQAENGNIGLYIETNNAKADTTEKNTK